MKLKEKCIYYDPSKDAYYLVLLVSDMVYGRYGSMDNPSYLDRYMNQSGTGLRFKIDNIIINMDYWRNYRLDDKELETFQFVKKLTDKEFYPIDLLIHSNYKYPDIIIDVHKHMNDVYDIVKAIRHKQSEMDKLKNDICKLEKELFISMQ